MSVQDDLRVMIRAYQVQTGHSPGEISIGRDAAEALADELWAEQSSFRFTGPRFTRKEAMDGLLAGEMRFMGVPIAVETIFPTPDQSASIEGYRQVGPC